MKPDAPENLPDEIVAALRAVPPADPGTRESAIAAALAEFDATDVPQAQVVQMRRRSPGWLGLTAGLVLVLGAGVGWVARGSSPAGTTVTGATDGDIRNVSVTAAPETAAAAVPPVKSGAVEVPGNPVRPNSGLPCASETAGAQYLGQYVRDTVLHLVFVSDFTIEVVRADTCEVLAAFQQPVAPAP